MKALIFVSVFWIALGWMPASAQIAFDMADTQSIKERLVGLKAQEDPPSGLTRRLYAKTVHVGERTVRTRVVESWYFATPTEVQNYGTDRIYFDERLDEVTVLAAASMDVDGRIHPFDSETLKVTDVDHQDTFTDSRQAAIALPGLGAGSLTLLEYEVVTRRTERAMNWAEHVFVQTGFPTQELQLNVTWLEGMDMNWHSDSQWVDCRQAQQSLTCSGRAIPDVDTATVQNFYDDVDQIVIAEQQTWENVAERSLDAFNEALSDTEGVKLIRESLNVSDAALEDKVAQIHRFVAKDIRYVSMSELGNTITPHSVSSTVSSRYGDCKDKSAVLYHLLKSIGLDAYPVLVATERRRPEKMPVPSMTYFDHMVVCFDWKGKPRCLDATDAYTDWRHTPAWIQGRVALPLNRSPSLSQIDSARYRWSMSVDSVLELTPEGDAEEVQTRTYLGEYAGSMRGFLSGMDAADRQEWAVRNYHQRMSDLATPSFVFDGVEQLTPELAVSSEATYESIVEPDAALAYVEHSAWLVEELESLYLDTTAVDSEFPGLKVMTNHVFDVGSGWALTALSPNLDLDHLYGSLERTVKKLNDRRFSVSTTLKVPRQTVPGPEVETFNQFLQALVEQSEFYFNGKLR